MEWLMAASGYVKNVLSGKEIADPAIGRRLMEVNKN